MKPLKKVLLVFLIAIATPLITALFIKKEYKAEQSIIVNKPQQEIFDFIKYLKNQEKFSPWTALDPKMEKTYNGSDGTVGFVSGWKSKNKEVGTGEQEIKKITEGESIEFELRFLKPFKSTSQAYMITEPISKNQTTVIWGFMGKMNYPMNLMILFMDFKKMVEDDFHKGLINLKTLMEK